MSVIFRRSKHLHPKKTETRQKQTFRRSPLTGRTHFYSINQICRCVSFYRLNSKRLLNHRITAFLFTPMFVTFGLISACCFSKRGHQAEHEVNSWVLCRKTFSKHCCSCRKQVSVSSLPRSAFVLQTMWLCFRVFSAELNPPSARAHSDPSLGRKRLLPDGQKMTQSAVNQQEWGRADGEEKPANTAGGAVE